MSSSILVIDDDPSILATVAEVLADEGYSVHTASNGAEGLATLKEHIPTLVLLDMRMPVLDGWGFVRALHERGIKLPIVVMTAAQDARKWGQEIGAVESLAKPFDLINLLSIVERLTGDGSTVPNPA
jgi:two-component system, chemotaxis family, chemotaxis protein CheY